MLYLFDLSNWLIRILLILWINTIVQLICAVESLAYGNALAGSRLASCDFQPRLILENKLYIHT